MATEKVTFTLDAATIGRLQDAAARLACSKSEVVREAITDFHDRLGRLSDKERASLLRAFDELVPRIPLQPAASVRREIAAIRRARRLGGRRTHSGSAA